jgi:excisionase family DNA binding protein
MNLTVKEAAERLGLSTNTLNRWRGTGEGPAFLKLGRRVLYREEDLAAWEQSRLRQNTAQGEE